ncbi:DUF3786 domain-containing protein [Chloroflexota bacterium]
MESKHLASPDQKNYEYAYALAYKLACEQLAKINDIEQQCHKSGAQYQVEGLKTTITVEYLSQPYIITLPDIKISLIDSSGEVPIKDKVLILHYLTLAKGTPAANRLITFRELPEGKVYSPTFSQRTVRPLLNHFGREPHLLIDAAKKLGGQKTDYGDTAVTINAFSRVPITIILWQGDDELPPQGNVVFDASISYYLPTEDITVLCETVTWKLVRYLKKA